MVPGYDLNKIMILKPLANTALSHWSCIIAAYSVEMLRLNGTEGGSNLATSGSFNIIGLWTTPYIYII